jgi:hypothetical protein
MLQASQEITIKLKAEQWNTVLQQLGEGPFRIVQSLIGEIQAQCMAAAGEERPPGPGNGELKPPGPPPPLPA